MVDTGMGEPRARRILYKWVGFVCAIWIQSIAGSNYAFANYASDLKHVLDYSQVELNTLSVAKDVGKGLGLFAGFLSEFLPPQIILLIGAGMGVIGYGSTWIILSQRIPPPALWKMCIVMFLGGNSSTWMNTACLTTCLRNFPESRGPVTGILIGFVGLSSAIFTVICSSLFTGSSQVFVLLLAFVPLFVCIVGAFFLSEVPSSTGAEEVVEEEKCFSSLNIIAIAIALYLLAYTLAVGDLEEALSSPIISKCVPWILLLLLVSPVIVPARLLVFDWFVTEKNRKKSAKLDEGIKEPLLHKIVPTVAAGDRPEQDTDRESLSLQKSKSDHEDWDVYDGKQMQEGESDQSGNTKQLGDDHNMFEALGTLDFWVMLVSYMTGIGAGMATINNVAQIGGSLGFNDVTIFVTLISIFGFFGRLISGILSEYYFRSRAIPRTVWMAASKIPMIIGFLILAFPTPGALIIGSIITGACLGFHATIIVSVASEMFGLKSFGLILNFINLHMSLGSFLFSYLAGAVYDHEAQRTDFPSRILPDTRRDIFTLGSNHRINLWSELIRFSEVATKAEGETECYGSHCFEVLFLIMSLVLAIGFMLDVILTVRVRPLYRKLANIKCRSNSDSDSIKKLEV
ncbi:hypothetical protein R1flu_010980 [Riccia fluitans]|uniref:Nodulin-like domain-containing protein n=1 Tax=Riccia fluitans TaxID=41844 RepID=A0ABD1Z6I2_9MARC